MPVSARSSQIQLRPSGFHSEGITVAALRDLREDSEGFRAEHGEIFGSGRSRLEEVCIKLYIDEEKEPYILNRLYREGRGGEITKIRDNQFLYCGAFFDTNELLSWVKTFTGRIMDIQGTNAFSIAKVTHDWDKMYQMYCGGNQPSESKKEVQ